MMKRLGYAILALPAVLLMSGCATGARVISPFGAYYAAEGKPRSDGTHRGVDIGGGVGEPVLAMADGFISYADANHGACGNMVMIRHDHFGRTTVYCHLQDINKYPGNIRRGDYRTLHSSAALRLSYG